MAGRLLGAGTRKTLGRWTLGSAKKWLVLAKRALEIIAFIIKTHPNI